MAKFANVAIDGAVAKAQLEDHLAYAEKLSRTDAEAGAKAAYSAYEAANVSFLNALFKAGVVAGVAEAGSAFAVGVIMGITGAATVSAAAPILLTLAIGWAADWAYDQLLESTVKDVLTKDFESTNSITDFIEGYINAHGVGQTQDGYISGATVFWDTDHNGVLSPWEVSTTSDASGNFALSGGSGILVSSGGIDLFDRVACQGSARCP